jgi:hypothetical protein
MHSVKTSLVARGRADVTRGRGWLASLVAFTIGFPRAGTDIPVEVRFDVASPSSGAASQATGTHDDPGGSGPRERWRRRFAHRAFSSEQFAGTGRFDRLVCERFGPLTLALALVVEQVPSSHGPTDPGSDCECSSPSEHVQPTFIGPDDHSDQPDSDCGCSASEPPEPTCIGADEHRGEPGAPPHTRLRLIVRGWTFLGIPLPRAFAPQCDAHESEQQGRFHFNVALHHRWTGLIVHYRGWLTPA